MGVCICQNLLNSCNLGCVNYTSINLFKIKLNTNNKNFEKITYKKCNVQIIYYYFLIDPCGEEVEGGVFWSVRP